MEKENNPLENLPEREFYDTYNWLYIVEHPTTSEITEIEIFADTYPESVDKLKKLKLPYKLSDYHLQSVQNFEPNVHQNIFIDGNSLSNDNSTDTTI